MADGNSPPGGQGGRRHEAAKPAASRAPRMTASSQAVGPEAASPAATLGGAQTGACLSPTQRRSLEEGDIVTWDATRVSMGSPEATARVTSGSIVGFYDDRQGVRVKRPRYSPYKMATCCWRVPKR